MLRTLSALTAAVFILMTSAGVTVQAESHWIGSNSIVPLSIEVLQHNNAFTEIEFDIKGMLVKDNPGEDLLYSFDGKLFNLTPSITKMVAIPAYKGIRLEIVESEFMEIDDDYPLGESENLFHVGEPGVMRDVRIVPVTVNPVRIDKKSGAAELLTYARIRLHYEGYSNINNKEFTGASTESFRQLYAGSIINYSWIDGGFEPFGKGTYLVIMPSTYMNTPFYGMWKTWKRQKGYHVEEHIINTTPTSWTVVRDIIVDYYENASPPLEYVVLVADINGGSITIPADLIQHPTAGEVDVTDHSYTLLEGEDYFSDLFIGRISVSSLTEAGVVFNKIVKYEKEPFVGSNGWQERMLSVGGNYNDSGAAPITPCQTSWWIADLFLDNGFAAADTILYWGPWDPNPGSATEINNMTNLGCSFVSYRGWADAHGWQYPYYTIDHLEDLENGWMLPVYTSFVCNTGDFGSNVNPCFGEAIIRKGSINNGKTGVGFLGPSDLHTNTNYNNAISSGFYFGLLEHDLHIFAQATNYGKMTLYEGFPNHRNDGDFVPFYFHVYNMLGDPGLEMTRYIPVEITMTIPPDLPLGAASIDVHVASSGAVLPGAYVTAVYNDELIAGEYTNSAGNASLQFDPLLDGEVTITTTKYGYYPEYQNIPVTSQNFVGYQSDELLNESNIDGKLNPGESATLRVVVKNYGSTAQNNVNATLTTYYPYDLDITPSTIALGNINPGATANADFDIVLDNNAPAYSVIEFSLWIPTPTGNDISKFELVVEGSLLSVTDVNPQSLTPGQSHNITISLLNSGNFTASGITAELSSFDEAVTIIDGSTTFGNISAGQTVVNSDLLTIQAASGAYEGRMLQMRLDLTPGNGTVETLFFDLVVGDPDSTDPGGPDPYGYFAYDDGDAGYPPTQAYNWIELDPNYGGSGAATRLDLPDDSTTTGIALPFDFTFYGETYDEVAICSNGWLSFEANTWLSNFRNWDLPSPIGPHSMICPYWDDLKDTTDTILDIYYWHDPSGKFIVEWSRVHNRYITSENRMETFEVILYDPAVQSGPTGDGDILYQYLEVNDVDLQNNFSTVGIQDWDHLMGLEYVFSENYDVNVTSAVLHNEMAILFTTTPPDNYVGVEDNVIALPKRYGLSQNYPNPFNNSTRIEYEIPLGGMTNLQVFDVNGRLIDTVFSGFRSPAAYSAVWHGTDYSGQPVSSGIYFIKLTSGDYQNVVKSVLIK